PLTINGGTFNLGSGLLTCQTELDLSSGTLEMNGNNISVSNVPLNVSGGTLNLSGQIDCGTGAITVSGGTINDTGSAGELKGNNASFTGGTSAIRKLTLLGTYSQSSTASVTINSSATWGGDWKMLGTSFTFKTSGVPTWSSGSLTIVPPGPSGAAGSWTFC